MNIFFIFVFLSCLLMPSCTGYVGSGPANPRLGQDTRLKYPLLISRSYPQWNQESAQKRADKLPFHKKVDFYYGISEDRRTTVVHKVFIYNQYNQNYKIRWSINDHVELFGRSQSFTFDSDGLDVGYYFLKVELLKSDLSIVDYKVWFIEIY